MKHLKPILKGLFWIVIVVCVIVAVGRFTFWVPGRAPDNAMAPTIWKGDRFIVLTRGEIDRGAIVYCDHPVYAGQVVTGRVVGMPGDTVEILGTQLRLNDDTVQREWEESFTYIDKGSGAHLTSMELRRGVQYIGGHRAELMYPEKKRDASMRKVKVKSGYFLLGDNRSLVLGASDSRNYGEVHPSLCKGRVLLTWKAAKGIGDPDLKQRAFKILF